MYCRRTLLMLLFLLVFAVVVSPFSSYAANKVWVGEIKGFDTRDIGDLTYMLTFNIVEDITDGRFGKFDEDEVLFTVSEEDGHVLRIILDSVSAGIYNGKKFEMDGYIDSVEFDNIVGSFRNPEIRYTLSDREIFSAEITVRSEKKLSIVRVPIDKSDTSMMSVSFKIVTEEGETEKLPPDARPGNLLELTPEDFADPFPNNIVELGGDLKKQLSSLNSLPEDSFVTFFYPLKFMRPSVARNLFSKKLSPWGWIEINDDHSIMVITDYVSYVRSIVESIIVFDKPIPQAQITAKVMEINITDKEARGFVYNFTRTGPDDIDVGASNLFDPNTYYSEGIAGAISHYSGSDYKKFTAALNMVISKGNANVLATPRALALNNQSTDFHVGETYYYLAPDSNSYYVERYDRDDDSGDHTKDRLTENSRFRTIQTGVHLNVRPYLQNSDFIECKIRLSYDEVVGFRGPMELPVAANRSIDSNVRIRDGQTLVIGGLFREKAMTVRKKIPGIGDVPLIKHLFNSKEEEKVKSELVFILTVNRIK